MDSYTTPKGYMVRVGQKYLQTHNDCIIEVLGIEDARVKWRYENARGMSNFVKRYVLSEDIDSGLLRRLSNPIEELLEILDG